MSDAAPTRGGSWGETEYCSGSPILTVARFAYRYPGFTGRLSTNFLTELSRYIPIRDYCELQTLLINRNPSCVNNLGDVDKYRYSVALVEFWFRTDAVLHQGLV